MLRSKKLTEHVIERFSEHHAPPDATQHPLAMSEQKNPDHLRRFFSIVAHRKRQILERMLFD